MNEEYNYGGMLTADEIRRQIHFGNIQVVPYDSRCVNPNSYNLKLHKTLKIYKASYMLLFKKPGTGIEYHIYITPDDKDTVIMEYIARLEKYDTYLDTITLVENACLDCKTENKTFEFEIPDRGFCLDPQILYIGRTVEKTFSNKFIPMINGRSSGGRLGIDIHKCAGFGDIGFNGTWTLEIACVHPVRIYPNMEIAQICWFKPYGRIKKLYRGRYQGQIDATASRIQIDKNSIKGY